MEHSWGGVEGLLFAWWMHFLLSEGTLKLNVNGSFLEGSGCFGVVRNHDRDWIIDFLHYEVGGDVLFTELHVIQICLNFVTANDITLFFIVVAWKVVKCKPVKQWLGLMT